ncbi:hypothetical protein BHE74_00008056, partial [Ensete ventricosum]
LGQDWADVSELLSQNGPSHTAKTSAFPRRCRPTCILWNLILLDATTESSSLEAAVGFSSTSRGWDARERHRRRPLSGSSSAA